MTEQNTKPQVGTCLRHVDTGADTGAVTGAETGADTGADTGAVTGQYRKTPRASFFDYEEGNYFITICTRNKAHYFGTIRNGQMWLSPVGSFLDAQLKNASHYFPEIEVPLYVIMPNHLHMIVCVNTRRDMPSACGMGILDSDLRNPNPYERPDATCQRHVPTLSRYINSLKGAVTKFAHGNNLEFGWQSRYHDHMIRGTHDGNRIAEYIENNVARWADDCFNK